MNISKIKHQFCWLVGIILALFVLNNIITAIFNVFLNNITLFYWIYNLLYSIIIFIIFISYMSLLIQLYTDIKRYNFLASPKVKLEWKNIIGNNSILIILWITNLFIFFIKIFNHRHSLISIILGAEDSIYFGLYYFFAFLYSSFIIFLITTIIITIFFKKYLKIIKNISNIDLFEEFFENYLEYLVVIEPQNTVIIYFSNNFLNAVTLKFRNLIFRFRWSLYLNNFKKGVAPPLF
ncbi:hypothetical protein SSYRP_v1c05150 [Spiroplasma syrphidicola EA-1]|uniref:Transmembrane protein n=1 Tax=Spiroplasma syrphidicola EA-1 TaxID=1276229 RepID=R4UIX9_9MOLU|nr:hypothetical protein [Spiroplasma syrphidicola]AGM26105.1 hypothetical protein SSYRP_v1c05150 [Spiroplasma syrphidicola EA-1]